VTWAVVIDMPENKVENLLALLDAKSLNYIEVIQFDLDDEDVEQEDEEEYEDDDDNDNDRN
jgi:hypothetical protein